MTDTIPRERAGVMCPECGMEMRMKFSTSFRRPFYACVGFPACRCTHGAHPNGEPMGVPADAITRKARRRAHAAFDVLWRTGGMPKSAAYRWMREAMGMTKRQAHIGRFSAAQCDRLVELVDRLAAGC